MLSFIHLSVRPTTCRTDMPGLGSNLSEVSSDNTKRLLKLY